MRIAINARLLLRNKLEGIGTFAFETLKRITAAHPEHEFIYLFDRKPDPSFITSSNISAKVIGVPARHPLLWSFWIKRSLPAALKKIKPDIFFSPDGFIPLDTTVPVLNTIHDINFEYHPEFVSGNVGKFYRKYFPLFATRSSRLITVSAFSKKTIVERYRVSSEKIDVIPNAAMDDFRPLTETVKTATRQKWTSGKPYFFYVGSINRRKNIPGLIAAYSEFRKSGGSGIKLVLAGSEKNIRRADMNIDPQFSKDIIFTGTLSHSELHHLLGSALALTYVPFFEGFGIPILEAMQCGVPVITSNCSSMPEVAGGAALLAEPGSIFSICEAMKKMVNDKNLSESLINKGLENAGRFSWDQTAIDVWKCIERVLKENT